jgi:AcrR family transcriptional regulator
MADTTLTRELLISTTRDLIADEGIEAVSLRRVARALGVTAPALYAYVTDKRDLLRGVAEAEFAQLIDVLEAIDEPDPVARIRQFSRAYVTQALAQPALFRIMFLFPPELGVAAATGEELPAATKAFELAMAAAAEAIESGALAPADPLMVGLALWTATHGAADVLLMGFGFDDSTRDQLVDAVIDTLIDGLRP